ncbi:MAG TPA: aldehyde dehydrogenase (NADP(+)) [Tepidisphaeraceae bacterium]|jgi:NADP-dependent aldehyde dehydrogenase
MELHGRQVIGGQAVGGASATFQGANPATGEKLGPAFHEATAEEVDRACREAAQSFDALRLLPPGTRAALLRGIADQIMALGEELVLRVMAETGLPRPRIEGERGRTCGQLRLFADVVEEGSWVDATIDRAQPDRQPLPKPDVRRMRVALGPVAVFGASNFPLAFSVAGGDTASALAAGCPVVCKGHPAHPGTSEMVARAIAAAGERCGLPAGVFAMLQGTSVEVGQAIVRHPAIKAVGFTGSLGGGRALYDEAARRPEPIPVYAEMGSTNPVFILPGALAERGEKIAEGLVGSVTMGVGQFCTKPGLVFLPESSAQPFVERTAQLLGAAPAGVMLHAGIAANFARRAARVGAASGVETMVKPEKAGGPGCGQRAVFFVTTVHNLIENPDIAEEVFGPSTIAVTCRSRTQVLEAARNLRGHLTATIHGTPQDLAQWSELVEILQTKVGRIIFNGWPTGVEVTYAMVHGGPYPATTDPRATSVGTAAIERWARPLCWQGFPNEALPEELRDGNPRGIWRRMDGKMTRE